MKNAGKYVFVSLGLVAGIAILVPITAPTRGAVPEGSPRQKDRGEVGDRGKSIKRPIVRDHRKPAVMSNTLALQRGCRDGGFKNINRTNPSWVSVEPSDAVTVAEGIVQVSKVTHEDYPTNHESHDWNIHVQPDAGYNRLLSDGNEVVNNARLMEFEWETKHVPDPFLPVAGDRIWAMGRWIFDCGHPPYRSEIHPPKAMAFSRLEPHTFRGDSAPSFVSKTTVFINGQGGYFYDPVGGWNYQFAVPLPPKPSPNAQARAEVVSVPLGGIQPQLFLEPNLNRIRVVYPLAGFKDPSPTRWNLYKNPLSQRPPQNSPRFGAIIASGWREPVLTKNYRTFRVTLNSLKINTDHDPVTSGDGEWNLWVRVNGTWGRIQGLGDVEDGENIGINRSILVTVLDSGIISLQTTGWEDDSDDIFGMKKPGTLPSPKIANENDKIGILERNYRLADNFGVGAHTDRSRQNGDADTNGDFQLTYRIEEVSRVPAGTVNNSSLRPVLKSK